MSKKIVISPYSRAMRNGAKNPKNYPWWKEVIEELKKNDCYVIQIGIKGEEQFPNVDEGILGASLKDLEKLISECDTWASVDNFFQHLAHLQKKSGVVIFAQGNPEIFGHSENKNLLKDKKYLREKQFDIWEACPYNEDAFVDPTIVVEALLS